MLPHPTADRGAITPLLVLLDDLNALARDAIVEGDYDAAVAATAAAFDQLAAIHEAQIRAERLAHIRDGAAAAAAVPS